MSDSIIVGRATGQGQMAKSAVKGSVYTPEQLQRFLAQARLEDERMIVGDEPELAGQQVTT